MSLQIDSSAQTEEVLNSAGLKKSRRQEMHHSKHLRCSIKKTARGKTQHQENQYKITQFLAKNQLLISNKNAGTQSNTILQESIQKKYSEISKKLSTKQEQIKELKHRNEENQLKLKKAEENQKLLFKKIGQSMLVSEEFKRSKNAEINVKLGYFVDGFRAFVEGQALTSLRSDIQNNTEILKGLQEKKKSKEPNSPEMLAIQGSYEFIFKQLAQQKHQLEAREKELYEYKERLKFSEKEQRSLYSKQKWPVIYEHYQTLCLLGAGGFGQVYKCYDLKTNKIVAIKRIIFDTKVSSKYKEQFYRHVEREIEIHKSLNHPNIAKLQGVLQIEKAKNCVVFQLEYCSGPQLSKYIKKYKTITEKQAKIIIKQVFCALNYLANLKQKIIHYDLKPSNIMFQDGVIKILDFGLCKIMEENQDTRIQLTSQGVGTYYYLPPQTFDEYDPKISPKVDVWSAGIIFYQMLFGKRPFGHGMSQQQLFNNAVILKATKVEYPSDLVKKLKISDGAKEFISACLKYDPNERLSPAQAFDHPYLKKLN